MYRENKNSPIQIYYKSDDLATGQSVIFSVWDVLGNTYIENVSATAEILNYGIYYINFTTPDLDTYLLVKASYANSSHPKSLVIACGFPADNTLFYVDPSKTTAITMPFSIFDIFGSIWSSGNLWFYGHGFYGTNVNSLKDGTYFLRVPPEAMKFTIPQTFENGLPIATGKGGASKARQSVFDYEGELTKRRIHAQLVTEEDFKGIMINLSKEEDQKTSVIAQLVDADKEWEEKWADKVNVPFVNPDLHKSGSDNFKPEFDPNNIKYVNTGDQNWPKSNGINPDLNKKDYIDKTNIVKK